MNEPVIELKHITKRFAKVLANDDVSITIHKGEVVALLGENGAGKSTIMKILYGLYHATSGEIWNRRQRTQDRNTKRSNGRWYLHDPAAFFTGSGTYSYREYHSRKL